MRMVRKKCNLGNSTYVCRLICLSTFLQNVLLRYFDHPVFVRVDLRREWNASVNCLSKMQLSLFQEKKASSALKQKKNVYTALLQTNCFVCNEKLLGQDKY